MASYNRVILIGNVTRDIEVRNAGASGVYVCDIGLAVNERRKQGNEWVDDTTFVDCTAFGKTAEFAGEHLAKGMPVLVEGRLKLESWEKDGQKRSKLKVIVDQLRFVGPKAKQDEAPQADPPSGIEKRTINYSAPAPDLGAPGDDLPF
jgi:single-strand DNA-binding protein